MACHNFSGFLIAGPIWSKAILLTLGNDDFVNGLICGGCLFVFDNHFVVPPKIIRDPLS